MIGTTSPALDIKTGRTWTISATSTATCTAKTSRSPTWPSGSARRFTSTARRRSSGQLKAIQAAFAEVDPLVCYAVKANSNLSILRVMAEHGSGFDVVSGGELYRVVVAGGQAGRTRLRRGGQDRRGDRRRA